MGLDFHNTKKNGFQPLIGIINHYNKNMSRDTWAFILGIVTHIIVDSTFHPFVNYFSGDINDKKIERQVRYRHRYLETFLDLNFKENIQLMNNGLFLRSYMNKEMDETDFLKLVFLLFNGHSQWNLKSIKTAMKLHCRIQKSFFKKWPQQILRFADCFPGVYMKENLALYYPRSTPLRCPFFQNPIPFLHPVTGEKQIKTIAEMEEKSVNDTLTIFKELADNWGVKNAIEVFSTFPAPNLHTGMINMPAENMTFFEISNDINELIQLKNQSKS